jgi:hypothetical protein
MGDEDFFLVTIGCLNEGEESRLQLTARTIRIDAAGHLWIEGKADGDVQGRGFAAGLWHDLEVKRLTNRTDPPMSSATPLA